MSEGKQKKFEDVANKLKTGDIELNILEKVKGVFQGQDKVQLNKATKIVKDELEKSDDYKLLKTEKLKSSFADRVNNKTSTGPKL